MIDPETIAQSFAEIESDLNRFRTLLKSHADIDELDSQFLALHNELFAAYDCSQCRNCCKKYLSVFEEQEIQPAAQFLGLSEAEFKAEYLQENDGELIMQTTPCPFLTDQNCCQLESCKPASCQNFPFTNQPERLLSLISLINAAEICPVVYEMMIRLMKIYRFRRRSYGHQ